MNVHHRHSVQASFVKTTIVQCTSNEVSVVFTSFSFWRKGVSQFLWEPCPPYYFTHFRAHMEIVIHPYGGEKPYMRRHMFRKGWRIKTGNDPLRRSTPFRDVRMNPPPPPPPPRPPNHVWWDVNIHSGKKRRGRIEIKANDSGNGDFGGFQIKKGVYCGVRGPEFEYRWEGFEGSFRPCSVWGIWIWYKDFSLL